MSNNTTVDKILIIPDVHNNFSRAEDIIYTHGPDRVIFLGDIYDSYSDTIGMIRRTALWHREALTRYEFLMGNHDINYAQPFNHLACGGFTEEKRRTINDIITPSMWAKTRFHMWVEQPGSTVQYLLSHAGVTKALIPSQATTLEDVKEYLSSEEKRAQHCLAIGEPHWFWQCGAVRSEGFSGHDVGGLLWCHFPDEFEPIPYVNQIFGHTIQAAPKFYLGALGDGTKTNLALDTRLNHYVTLTKAGLKVHTYDQVMAANHKTAWEKR